MSRPAAGGLLFVYGSLRRALPASLRPEEGREAFALLSDHAEFVGAGDVQGRLHAVSWYPGLTPTRARAERVCGEVWRLDDRRLLAVLDDYEGAEYVRARRVVRLKDGSRELAWTYIYDAPLRGAPRIESGDYVGWLKRPG